MTEVAPMVTHHQVSVNGKTLRYSATTGRLPIKRGDGKSKPKCFLSPTHWMARIMPSVR